jgi:hypothetical protein
MRKPTLLLAALIALVLGLTACGDEESDTSETTSGDELTAEEFAAEADALCESFNKEHPIPPEAQSAKEAAKIAQDEADLRVELMEQMTAIAAPEEAQADLDTYNEQTLAIVDVIEEQAAAAQDEDQAAFQAGFAEIDTLTAERAQTAAALGFEKCGLAATTASDSEGSEGANEPID